MSTRNLIFTLEANSLEHQNIFEAPWGYITRANNIITHYREADEQKQDFGEEITIPTKVINSGKDYKGKYYFTDFSKLIDFAVQSPDIH